MWEVLIGMHSLSFALEPYTKETFQSHSVKWFLHPGPMGLLSNHSLDQFPPSSMVSNGLPLSLLTLWEPFWGRANFWFPSRTPFSGSHTGLAPNRHASLHCMSLKFRPSHLSSRCSPASWESAVWVLNFSLLKRENKSCTPQLQGTPVKLMSSWSSSCYGAKYPALCWRKEGKVRSHGSLTGVSVK